MKPEFNIWWKLVPLAAALFVLSLIGLAYLNIAGEDMPLTTYFIAPVFWFMTNAYLSSFCLWHWKTRYKGDSHPFYWALVFFFWWAYFPSLMYFLSEMVPDMRGKGAYATLPEASAPAPIFSPQYYYGKSLCYVTGFLLIALSIIGVGCCTSTGWFILGALIERVPKCVPNEISQSFAPALLRVLEVFQSSHLLLGACAILGILGGVLIAISQRIRWRLLDEKSKQ